MIAFINGDIVAQTPKGLILSTDSGIGYEVRYSQNSHIGEKKQLYIYHSISEQDQILWAFDTIIQRELFKLIISVNKVGPSKAFPIVTLMDTSDLIETIMSENVNELKKFPGIGPKMAQQIVFSLSDKIQQFVKDQDFHFKPLSKTENTVDFESKENAILALNSLGYETKQVERALENIVISKAMSSEELIKSALKYL